MTKLSPSDRTIIFVHILKTAGMTVNLIIEKQYAKDRSYSTFPSHHHPQGNLETFKEMSTAQKEKLDVLYGHMGYGLHDYLPKTAVYFTILRNPIERVISRFYHIYRGVKSPLHNEVRSGKMDLIGFVKHMAEAGHMDNLQTRMIAGNWAQRGYGECNEHMLETAKQNLHDRFVIVGLTERFDETCLLMQKTLGWQDTYYEKQNVTKKRPQQKDISADALRVVQEYNQFDIELYNYGVALFEEQIRAQGPSFAKEVKKFQNLNLLRKYYWQARKISVRAYANKLLGQ